MDNKRPVGEPFESTGREVYGNGWRFRFNVQPMQNGALYLINEAPGQTEYNVLFPTRKNNSGSPLIDANKRVETDWYRFVENQGIEKLWVIWSPQTIPELDAIFRKALEEEGEISGADQMGKLQSLLDKYKSPPPDIKENATKDMITLRGRSEALVSLVELNHKPY
jgi:hypothetical protein